jgi:hypothetical protein
LQDKRGASAARGMLPVTRGEDSMNPPRSLRRWLVGSAILLGALGLIALLVLRDRANQQPNGEDEGNEALIADGDPVPVTEGNPNDAAKLVDAIVNHNQAPKKAFRPSGEPRRVALFPENYDWKEDVRVLDALHTLYRDRTVALWEELVRRESDPKYCITLVSVQTDDARIDSVGTVCHGLAYWRLLDLFQAHLSDWEGRDGRPITLVIDMQNLAVWRKERANKSLYQLQIEVGENALGQVSSVKGVSEDDKALARRKMKGEIARLKRTKQAYFVPHQGATFPYLKYGYSPSIAKRIREAVKSGSSETIEILK